MELSDACPSEDSAEANFFLRAANRPHSYVAEVGRFIQGIRFTAKHWLRILGILALGLTCGAAVACYVSSRAGALAKTGKESSYWDRISQVDLKNLSTIGKNPYFNLEPGYRLCYTSDEATLTITVRRKTKVVDGVETRVVEEKEQEHGQPTKVVWKYYAIDKTTGALYCFGVHIQTYCKGSLTSHRGWRSGAHGAMFTLVLPAVPTVGDTLLRNHRPEKPRRQDAVIDVAGKVVTPAGTFTNCLGIESKGSKEGKVKVFAPSVGLVQDGQFALTKIVQTVPRNKAVVSAN